MKRNTRLFELIQIVRARKRPVTAQDLAEHFEVSERTIYRDIASLQASGVPLDGEAGIGYIMRAGYELPPLNFDIEEIEALRVGLSMIARTGDHTLMAAADSIRTKIDALAEDAEWLQVAPWGAPEDSPEKGCVSIALLRRAIRDEQKLRLTYRDANDNMTERVVRPFAMVYHIEAVLLAAWCELRGGIRHFRSDRLYGCTAEDSYFKGQSPALRDLWQSNSDNSFHYDGMTSDPMRQGAPVSE